MWSAPTTFYFNKWYERKSYYDTIHSCKYSIFFKAVGGTWIIHAYWKRHRTCMATTIHLFPFSLTHSPHSSPTAKSHSLLDRETAWQQCHDKEATQYADRHLNRQLIAPLQVQVPINDALHPAQIALAFFYQNAKSTRCVCVSISSQI